MFYPRKVESAAKYHYFSPRKPLSQDGIVQISVPDEARDWPKGCGDVTAGMVQGLQRTSCDATSCRYAFSTD